jgi:DMSO reductase anchor subunit
MPKSAWRALNHLRKSWLSREILFVSGFAGSWAILTGLRLFQIGTFPVWTNLAVLTAIFGLAAVYCMQRVYQLRSVPSWNTNRTLLEFTISSVLLGCLLTGTFLPRDAPAGVMRWIALSGIIFFSAAGIVTRSIANTENMMLSKWRAGLILVGLLGIIALLIWPIHAETGNMVLVFILALAEEAIGRWLFYARRNPGI